MNRRQVLTLGAGVAGISALKIGEVRADHHAAHAHHHGDRHDRLAQTIADCANHCNSCFDHCARMVARGHQDHVDTMRLCNDCATICGATAALTSRRGPLAGLMWAACAEACDKCAAACGAFSDDAHMAACAKACRECAAACRAMIEKPPR